MRSKLFREGGPHKIRKTGRDEYSFSVSIPVDQDGLLGRECPGEDCSPGYFKVKPGTGITEGQIQAFCPYCRTAAKPSGFTTKAQIEYAKRSIEREAAQGVDRAIRDALRLGPTGRRKLVDGLISVELSMKPARVSPVGRPLEEELRRDITCPHCGLEHAVFGLATWCPDCSKDIFLTHVAAELEGVRRVLCAVEERRRTLGPRVAARDVENALEDLVSVTEAVLKTITRRHLISLTRSREHVDDLLDKQIRNGFQSVLRARELLLFHTGAMLGRSLSEADLSALADVFEKRHPIAHNLGVVDRKYLARARSGDITGREVRITADEVTGSIDMVHSLLADVWNQLFSPREDRTVKKAD